MRYYIILFTIIMTYGCNRSNDPRNNDSKYRTALELNSKIRNKVFASIETTPTNSAPEDDSADDPAIWINKSDIEKSTIIGTNKKAGLSVYSLSGKELFYYPVGRVNNVDVRYKQNIGGEIMDIVACSNRSENSITVFSVDTTNGALNRIKFKNSVIPRNKINDVYGFCLYQSRLSDKLYAFINSKSGSVMQKEFSKNNNGEFSFKDIRYFRMSSQTEGMVADDENATLFIGEEQKGIWKISAEPGDLNKKFIQDSKINDSTIVDDIEGICIYYTDKNDGYLLASSQGNFSYAVFERNGNNKYLGSFKIENNSLDKVEETDGIDVINLNMGSNFPNGFMVVQDGFNFDNDTLKSQNFKIIKWEDIALCFPNKLKIDNKYNSWLKL